MDSPDLQSTLQEARRGFAHVNQIAWLEWGSLLLPHMPATSAINDKLEALAIKIQEAEDSFTEGVISQEEYNVVTADIEEKKGLLQRELQLVGSGSLGKERTGESEESGNAQSESDIAGAAGLLDDNRPTPRAKRKADDILEDIRGDAGTTKAARPPIPMMTVPNRKKEKGSSKQVASSSVVDDDKAPEGPVSDCPMHVAAKLIRCAYCSAIAADP
jgi:hypothetical protein